MSRFKEFWKSDIAKSDGVVQATKKAEEMAKNGNTVKEIATRIRSMVSSLEDAEIIARQAIEEHGIK